MSNYEQGKELFRQALTLVSSQSTRDWATSAHNRPLFERYCENLVAANRRPDPLRLATYITCLKIGL